MDIIKIANLLNKYKHQKPKTSDELSERCYPASAVTEMLKESNWEEFSGGDMDFFGYLVGKGQCVLKFDNGTECNFNDDLPAHAICTHFRKA